MVDKMSQPLNPNTLLPMSLEVDRIHQINEQQPGNKQALTSDQLNIKNRKKQKQVNAKSKTEQGRVRDDDAENKQANSEHHQQNEHEDNKKHSGCRGNYFDVNV